jgi:hypothetical protein
VLCFGPQDMRLDDLPEGVLHPRRIASGVVAGIEDYGIRWVSLRYWAVVYDRVHGQPVYSGQCRLAPRGSNPHGIQQAPFILLGGKNRLLLVAWSDILVDGMDAQRARFPALSTNRRAYSGKKGWGCSDAAL